MWRVTDKTTRDILLDQADRHEATAFADEVTGRAKGTTAYVLGRRRSVYVQGRASCPSVTVARIDDEGAER